MSTADTNKITYGIKNVYFATITSEGTDSVVYDTPKPLTGAISISLAKSYEKIPISADDDPEYASVNVNKGYEGELMVYQLPEDFRTACLGTKVDGDTTVENKEDKLVPFALLFEFSGDKLKKRHCMYRCLATPPDVASTTTGDKNEANQIKIPITASPAKDTGDIKRSCVESESEIYTGWFAKVPTSGSPVL